MNPFDVQKIINESSKNGERLVIEELSKRCGVRLRHAHLRMSRDMFEYQERGGFPRHWVKGVSLYGWVTLWNYTPPKVTDFSVMNQIPQKEYKEVESLSSVKNANADKKSDKK